MLQISVITDAENEFSQILGQNKENIIKIELSNEPYHKKTTEEYAAEYYQNFRCKDEKIARKVDKFIKKLGKIEKYVYILGLRDDHWYVGYTKNPHRRMDEHFMRWGSVWTDYHRPKTLITMFSGDEIVENNVTIEMMRLFGIDKVRGGKWCELTFSEDIKRELQRLTKDISIEYLEKCKKILTKIPEFEIRKENKIIDPGCEFWTIFI
jgi:predicted GIY-YIG superfamily endonuclease